MSDSAMLKQIQKKLDLLDVKVSALLVREEPATPDELHAIHQSEKEFAEGKYKFWDEIKSQKK